MCNSCEKVHIQLEFAAMTSSVSSHTHSKFERACQCVACKHPSTLPSPSMWTAAGFCHRRFMSSFVVDRRWKCSRSSPRVSDWQMFLRDILLLLQRATAQRSGEPPVARLDDDRWCQRDKTGSRIKGKGMWRWKMALSEKFYLIKWSWIGLIIPLMVEGAQGLLRDWASRLLEIATRSGRMLNLADHFLLTWGKLPLAAFNFFWPRNFSGAYLRESSCVHISPCSGNNNHPSCDICNARWSQLTE